MIGRLLARSGTALVAALVLVDLVDELFGFLPFGAADTIRIELGLTFTQMGWLLLAPTAGGVVGLAAVVAADHVSRRVLSAAGAFAYAGCLGVFAVADTFPPLLAAAFVLGLASDAMVHGAQVALVDVVEPARLDTVLARQNTVGYVGDLLGPALLAAVAALGWGWRPAFVIGAALVALYGLWLALLPLPAPADAGSAREAAAGVWRALRDPFVWLSGVTLLVLSVFDEPYLGFTIAFLGEDRGQSVAVATVVAAGQVVGGLVVSAVLSVREEGSRRVRLVAGGALTVAGAVALPVVPSIGLQLGAGVAVGAGVGLAWKALQATYLSLQPGRAGTVSAVMSGLSLPSMAFPVVAGVLADRSGAGAAMAAYALASVVLAVGTAALAAHPVTVAPREPSDHATPQ